MYLQRRAKVRSESALEMNKKECRGFAAPSKLSPLCNRGAQVTVAEAGGLFALELRQL